MDWSSIATSFIASGATVAVAYISIRPELRKTSRAAQSASEAAAKTEASINNRPNSASDRWDLIGRDVQRTMHLMDNITHAQFSLQEDIATLRAEGHQTHREISDLRRADTLMREDSLAIRRDLASHINESAEYLPLIEDLHARYISGGPYDSEKRTDPA